MVTIQMNPKRRILLAKTLLIFAAVPVLIWAHSSGPDPGNSGVPGEFTCAQSGCHVGTPLNGGGGSVMIDAGGTTYTYFDKAGNVTESVDGDGNPTFSYFDGDNRATSTPVAVEAKKTATVKIQLP